MPRGGGGGGAGGLPSLHRGGDSAALLCLWVGAWGGPLWGLVPSATTVNGADSVPLLFWCCRAGAAPGRLLSRCRHRQCVRSPSRLPVSSNQDASCSDAQQILLGSLSLSCGRTELLLRRRRAFRCANTVEAHKGGVGRVLWGGAGLSPSSFCVLVLVLLICLLTVPLRAAVMGSAGAFLSAQLSSFLGFWSGLQERLHRVLGCHGPDPALFSLHPQFSFCFEFCGPHVMKCVLDSSSSQDVVVPGCWCLERL